MDVSPKAFRPGCVIELDGEEQRELRLELRRLTANEPDPTVSSELADWLELGALRKTEVTPND